MTQLTAPLRVCASCEWVFKGGTECPKCRWVSYGARFVFGPKCYRYAVSQEPWKQRKLFERSMELEDEIRRSLP